MPKIQYEQIRLRADSLKIIDQANQIIAEYQAAGFTLTLRQLYYQFVARDIIPNTERSYKNLGSTIERGRMAGLIDWEAIEDRTRFVRDRSAWNAPADIVATCARQFHICYWDTQPTYVEVWIEKDALIGVIEGVCTEYDLPYLACRGYASASEVWRAGHERFRPKLKPARALKPKRCHVLYLGDHDPSGIDMTRDVQDRLRTFAGEGVTVERLALNRDQIDQYDPPPNPTKLTDSRATGYIDQHGEDCWELDALEPQVIADLIEARVRDLIEWGAWDRVHERETDGRDELRRVAEHWDSAVMGADEDTTPDDDEDDSDE